MPLDGIHMTPADIISGAIRRQAQRGIEQELANLFWAIPADPKLKPARPQNVRHIPIQAGSAPLPVPVW